MYVCNKKVTLLHLNNYAVQFSLSGIGDLKSATDILVDVA